MAPRNSSLILVGFLFISLFSSFSETAYARTIVDALCEKNLVTVIDGTGALVNQPCSDVAAAQTLAFKNLCEGKKGTVTDAIGGVADDFCSLTCISGVVPLGPTETATPACGSCCCA